MEILLIIMAVIGLALAVDALMPAGPKSEHWIPQARVGVTTLPEVTSLRQYIPPSLPRKPEAVEWLL